MARGRSDGRPLVARCPEDLPGGRRRAVAIGNFDGVHRGHRAVLQAAGLAGSGCTVVTFAPHPRAFFGAPPADLGTIEQRIDLLAAAGGDEVLVARFDAQLAALEPETWADRYLAGIGAEVVAVGADFRFGRNRRGDAALLRRLGFAVREVPRVPGVSSSSIRALVAAGRLAEAAALLGRDHELEVRRVPEGGGPGSPGLRVEPVSGHPALPPSGRYATCVDGLIATLLVDRERGRLVVDTSPAARVPSDGPFRLPLGSWTRCGAGPAWWSSRGEERVRRGPGDRAGGACGTPLARALTVSLGVG